MQNFYVGCGPIPTRKRDYFNEFNALEITESWYQPVGLERLEKWREEAGPNTHLTLHIWRWIALDHLNFDAPPPMGLNARDVGHMRVTESNERLWKTVVEQVEAADADSIWIRTPASLSPSLDNQKRLRAFQKDIIGDLDVDILWEARGMWDLEFAREFAEDIGWSSVIEPYQEFEFPEPQGKNGVYAHHQPRGRKNFDRDDCEDLLDIYEEHEGDVLAIFRGPSRHRNARRMKHTYNERF